MDDPHLVVLTEEASRKHGCHTLILYGSRARGEATATSDYDVLGIRDGGGDVVHDARAFAGTYLDLFVYPIAKLKPAKLMHVRGGRVLMEKDRLGSRLLARLNRLHAAGPKPLPADEKQALRVWANKMLDRIKGGDAEANYRRVWLLTTLLEDYFLLRERWYEGPRESLRWLAQNDPPAHEAFLCALKHDAGFPQLQRLVKIVSSD